MKSKLLYAVTLLCVFIGTNDKIQAQITRGAQPGEIYISINWYIDNSGNLHDAIFRSTDNGENLTLQFETLYNPPPGEMRLGRVLGDATPGALYNWGWNKLWVSFDYGGSWEYREDCPDHARYLSGQNNGTIFKRIGPELSQSDNYGNTFTVITNPISCPIRELGYYLGEFFGINGNIGEGLFLDHTLDYANTYTEIPIDSTVAFWQIGSYYPQISRGTEPGELYLMSWWPGSYYKIFHSIDTGYTWAEKFESGYIDIYYWGVSYTGGRDPGSFYVTRSTQDPTQSHAWLYIDYSSDYGETFTTYFHDLDSLYTSIAPIKKPEFRLSAFPNPFSEKTTIVFELPANCKTPVLNICNIHGNLIKEYELAGKEQVSWDGTGISGQKVESGIYLYRITSGRYQSQLNKIVYIKH